ncbi:GNAT family N-acetyltransferase [Streptomyces hesseae]|uniref:GNAT family N-acetyltransferase n=1 Tax=Streptomyces hesseae TaxID=3075519 RepID=A0ABU2SLX7_9ACTN|nr:GNAT family N-acetyltransferase [Streptomyces sp. DSM 40473]MDT0449793.1 GNAT family N-acetyltransferase [Streptomyces sp. DSM 40473]
MTSTFPDISISTDRLVLRPFEAGDIPPLAEMMNDELVTAWTSAPYPYTTADARDWALRRAPSERLSGRGIVFAVAEFLTQRLVGTLHLRNTDWRTLTAEVAYVTAPWARGEGYACEAVLAAAEWIFRDQKFERLEMRTAADNTAAQQVAQKAGCVSEGVLRSAWIARSRNEGGVGWTESRTDLLIWSLLPEDLDELQEPRTGGGYDYTSAGGYASALHNWR